METEEIEIFYPTSLIAWRKWLEINHLSKQAVWLVFYNKKSNNPTISWSEAVDVALCFGWIDSKKSKIDFETSHQYFSKRKPKSTWSRINKLKIEKLIEQNLMTEQGMKSIEIAKQNGSWIILDSVEELSIPNDLKELFDINPIAKVFYDGLSKSVKKTILQWLVLAKRQETRQNRINEIIQLGNQKLKPKNF